MPVIRGSLTPADGPLVQVRIGLSRAGRVARHQATPPPLVVTALLDTGVERTCVEQALVARLSLPLHGAAGSFTLTY